MGTVFSCSSTATGGRSGERPGPRSSAVVRLGPRARRLGASSASGAVSPPVSTLRECALWALASSLESRSAAELASLPLDLSQELLDLVIEGGFLDEEVVAKLAGIEFYAVCLGRSASRVSESWLATLASERLLELDLARSGISPSGLPALPNLRTANLSGCNIDDGELEWLAGCKSLVSLSLADTSVGPLAVERLSRCTALRELDLSKCRRLRHLAPLSTLRELRRLSLACCPRVNDADMGALAMLPELCELDLSAVGVTGAGLDALAGAVALETLRLDGTVVADDRVAPLLARLGELRRLSLSRCFGVADGSARAAAAYLPRLEELDLGRTRVGNAGLRALAGAKSLRVLRLESCQRISDKGVEALRGLASLEALDLDDCRITSDCVPALVAMPSLQRLSLAYADLDDVQTVALARCATLRSLSLDSRGVGDATVRAIATLPGLRALDLFGAAVTDAACAALGAAPALAKLEICSGAITSAGVERLCRATSLVELSVANNPLVGDAAVRHLLKLQNLRSLNLSGCSVSTSAVLLLASLPNLETVALNGTRVRASAAESLARINPRLHVKGLATRR